MSNDNVLKHTAMMGAQLFEYTKNHGIVYFKWVTCMVCELYLHKALKNTLKNQCSSSSSAGLIRFPYKFHGCLKEWMIQNSKVWRKGPKTDASSI